MGLFSWIGDTFHINELRDAPKPPAPAPVKTPTYAETMRDVLQAQIDLAQPLFEAEKKTQPQYAELQSQISDYLAQQQLTAAAKYYPQIAGLEAKYQELNKQNELARLKGFLPTFQETLAGVTPGYKEAVATMGDLARQSALAATQRKEMPSYLSEVSGPSAGQYLSAVQGYAPGQELKGIGEYVPGTQLQGVGVPAEVGYLRGVRGPAQRSGLENINQRLVQQYIGAMPGMRQATDIAGARAVEELAAGRGLTPEEERISQQAARSAYASRGMALGGQSIAAEILGREQYANQRMQQRLATAGALQGMVQQAYTPALQQAFARQQYGAQYGLEAQQALFAQQSARENLAQQIQQQAYAQAMGRESMLKEAQQQAYAQALNREQLAQAAQAQEFSQALAREGMQQDIQQREFAQALQREQAALARESGQIGLQAQQAQMAAGALGQQQAAQAPALQMFTNQPILQGERGTAANMALAGQQQMGPQLFNPESQTGFGTAMTDYMQKSGQAAQQYQQNMATYNAEMQRRSQTRDMIGTAIGLGAAAAFCWVAREVYGKENPKWKQFRAWMFAMAPNWFFRLYLKYGERFALFIKNKPLIKNAIKKWMDSKINQATA